MSKNPYPIVEVEWDDSCASGGWRTVDAYKDSQTSTCHTAGYQLVKDRKRIIIIQSRSEDTGNVTDAITIPMSAVKNVVRLSPAERKKK